MAYLLFFCLNLSAKDLTINIITMGVQMLSFDPSELDASLFANGRFDPSLCQRYEIQWCELVVSLFSLLVRFMGFKNLIF